MADLFGYTQTDNVRVDTRPTMVNQRPDMRAADAFNSISSLLQTGVKAYGMAKESKQKDSFLEASKEANSLYDWYSGEINKTEDAYEKANILEQYKTGLSSIKEGYQLSEENALTFDNATKRFVGSQTMAIDTIVKKQQVSDIDSGMTEIFKTMVSSPIEDVAKMMKDASSAYDVVGMDKKEVSDKLFSMYASIKINGLQTKEAWATDASTIAQELKDVAKAYDPKLIGKDSYTKFIGQLDKIKTIQSQSMKDSVKIFEASDEFKNYIVPPKDYLTFLESNNVADAKAKAIIYNKDYEMLSKYDPINVHPDSTANPELAKKRANLVINQAMQGGDYVTALNVIDTTGEVGGLRAAVTTGINSNDVKTLNNTANIVRKMFNMNSVAMIDKVLTNETDRAIGMYLSHLVETNGQITETDVAFIDKAKQNKERYPLSKEFNENFKKDYGTTYDFAKNKQVASIMAKMGVPEDKIEEHFKAYYDKTIITDVIDMSGVGNLPYSNDIIEEALTPILDDFKATNFTKPSFVYNPGTQTMWLANEGIITQDTGIAIEGEGGLKDIIGGYVSHKAFYEELDKKKRQESGNDDKLGFSEANKANAYYDLFERGGGIFKRFIDAFKKPFMLEGSELEISNEQPKNQETTTEKTTPTMSRTDEDIVTLKNMSNFGYENEYGEADGMPTDAEIEEYFRQKNLKPENVRMANAFKDTQSKVNASTDIAEIYDKAVYNDLLTVESLKSYKKGLNEREIGSNINKASRLHRPTEGSGITIAAGLDASATSRATMKRLGVPERILKEIDALKGWGTTNVSFKKGSLGKNKLTQQELTTIVNNIANEKKVFTKKMVKSHKNLSPNAIGVLASLKHWAGDFEDNTDKVTRYVDSMKDNVTAEPNRGQKFSPLKSLVIDNPEATDADLKEALNLIMKSYKYWEDKRTDGNSGRYNTINYYMNRL